MRWYRVSTATVIFMLASVATLTATTLFHSTRSYGDRLTINEIRQCIDSGKRAVMLEDDTIECRPCLVKSKMRILTAEAVSINRRNTWQESPHVNTPQNCSTS